MKRPVGQARRSKSRAVARRTATTKVIDNFSAIVTRGEKIVLIGRNGVGKTTLLKALLANSPTVPDASCARRAATMAIDDAAR